MAIRIFGLLAVFAALCALSPNEASAASCEPQNPDSTTAGKQVANVVKKRMTGISGGYDHTVTQGSQFVPDSWVIGCSIFKQVGRTRHEYIFMGPQTDGKAVVGKLTGLKEQCSPERNVGVEADADELYKWPGTWKTTQVLLLRQESVIKKRMYVPVSWKPGCMFINQRTARGDIYANFMGDPIGAPVVVPDPAPVADNSKMSMDLDVLPPDAAEYSRSGSRLSNSSDDFTVR